MTRAEFFLVFLAALMGLGFWYLHSRIHVQEVPVQEAQVQRVNFQCDEIPFTDFEGRTQIMVNGEQVFLIQVGEKICFDRSAVQLDPSAPPKWCLVGIPRRFQ